MRKLWAILVAGTIVLAGCGKSEAPTQLERRAQETAAKRADAIERIPMLLATVKVSINYPNSDGIQPTTDVLLVKDWIGSGTVVKRADDSYGRTHLFILTAKHVVADKFPGTFHVTFVNHELAFELDKTAEVFQVHPKRDLALLRVTFEQKERLPPCGVAELAFGAPVRWETVYAAGVAKMDEILINRGEMVGRIHKKFDDNPYSDVRGNYVVNAEVLPGYSGGGTWVRQLGEWRLVGVNVMISVYGWGAIVPEQAWIEPLHEIRAWFEALGW